MEAVCLHKIIEKDGEISITGLPCKKGQHVEMILLMEPSNVPTRPRLTARQLLSSELIGLWKDRRDIDIIGGTMNQLVEKLASLERAISSEKGDFSLFALFLREDSYDRWDLLVSSPWIEINEKKGLEYLVMRINSTFKPHELLSLSRIVILVHDAVNTRRVEWCFYLSAGWTPAPRWGRLPAGLKLHYAIWLRI